MEYKQLIKLIKLIRLLERSAGVTYEEIGQELDVGYKQATNWIRDLQGNGGLILDRIESEDRKVRFRFPEDWTNKLRDLVQKKLEVAEIIALYLIKSAGNIFEDTQIGQEIENAYSKLEQLAPDGLINLMDKFTSLFLTSKKFIKEYSEKEEIIEVLIDAMMRNRTCTVEYHALGTDKINHYYIHPLHFFEHKNGLYLFVNVQKYSEIRILAVERISFLKIEEEKKFEYPEEFDAKERLERSFDLMDGEVFNARIWMSKKIARFIKARKDKSIRNVIEQDDGSIIVEMETAGQSSVKSWVLGFGANAEVLEPEDLRQKVIKELNSSVRRYEN
jgi:predicted DNA-binding transcriptional regulator YafY